MKKLSVVTILYNSKMYLPFFFQSIRKQTFQDFDVLAIDNGSIDGSFEWMKKFEPQVTVVRHQENLGFSKANNEGIHWTSGEYIFFLNSDIVIDRDAFEKLILFCDSSEDDVAGATPKIFYWDFFSVLEKYGSLSGHELSPLNIESADIPGRTDRIDSLGLAIEKSHRVQELGAGAEGEQAAQIEPLEIFGASGAAFLIKRKALYDVAVPCFESLRSRAENAANGPKKLEFFDEDFFIYKEDVDLAYRLRSRGWKTFLIPSALAYHCRTARQKVASVGKNRKTKSAFVNYHSYKNHWFFLIKNLSFGMLFRFGAYIIFYEVRKFFYILLMEISTLSALREIAKKAPRMLKKRRYILHSRRVSDSELARWMK